MLSKAELHAAASLVSHVALKIDPTLLPFVNLSKSVTHYITMRLNYVDPVYLMLHFIRTGVDHLHFRTDKADRSVLDSKLKVSLY